MLVGRVIHIASPFPTTGTVAGGGDATDGATDKTKSMHGVRWSTPEAFLRLLYTPRMIANHLPSEYLAGLKQSLDATAEG
jgi:hypothetical protein